MSVVKNKSRKEVEHSLKHIKLVIDMFESNNKILSEPENTLFIIVYGLLACMAGKGMLETIKGEGLLQSITTDMESCLLLLQEAIYWLQNHVIYDKIMKKMLNKAQNNALFVETL